jgi:hypothetical protein
MQQQPIEEWRPAEGTGWAYNCVAAMPHHSRRIQMSTNLPTFTVLGIYYSRVYIR